jgi:hypothetical protein
MENEMVQECGTFREEERCLHGFLVGKNCRINPTLKAKANREV